MKQRRKERIMAFLKKGILTSWEFEREQTASEIDKLMEMREKGIITPDEFERKQASILLGKSPDISPHPDYPTEAATPDSSVSTRMNDLKGNASDIEKLAELRDKGILTSEEFEKKKSSILSNANREEATKRCPYCGEIILAVAIKCKHCGSDLGDVPVQNLSNSIDADAVPAKAVHDTFPWLIAWTPAAFLLGQLAITGSLSSANQLLVIALEVLTYSTFIVIDSRSIEKAGRLAPSIGWLFLVPVYLYQRSKLLKKTQAPFITNLIVIAFVILLPFLNVSSLGLGNNDQYVQMVKGGTLTQYPNKTLGAAVDGFFGDPKWQHIQATDGKDYVNVSGKITVQEKGTSALLQFSIDKQAGTFAFRALEFDGVAQNLLTYASLLQSMYK